jgi:hypothetical protein
MFKFLRKIAERIGIVNLGGIVNIENFNFQNRQESSRPRNEQILLKQVRVEVHSRLEQSLYAHFIVLDKELEPQKVERIWDDDIKVGLKDSEPLPDETSILDVFNRNEIGGKLLIIGEPGAGKTTTLLELARTLIENHINAEPEYPIPVLLNLSSWLSGDIFKWLVEELQSKYGVRKGLGAKLLSERKLLLLLDGLDELKPEFQGPCVRALNQYLTGGQAPESIAICCRSEEYSSLKTRLRLNGAMQIKPLSNEQILNYLSKIYQKDLAFIIQETELMKLLRTPLMLGVAALAYRESSPKEWVISRGQSLVDISFRQKQELLWDDYIRRVLNSRYRTRVYGRAYIPNPKKVEIWLRVLARILREKREFSTEEIQVYLDNSLIPPQHFLEYSAYTKLVVGWASFLFFSVFYTLSFGDIVTGLGGGLVSVFLTAPVAGKRVTLLARSIFLNRYNKATKSRIIKYISLIFCVIIFAFVLIPEGLFEPSTRLAIGVSIGFFSLALTSLSLVTRLRISTFQKSTRKSYPFRGVKGAVEVVLIQTIIVGILSGVLAGSLVGSLIFLAPEMMTGLLMGGLRFGMHVGVVSGLLVGFRGLPVYEPELIISSVVAGRPNDAEFLVNSTALRTSEMGVGIGIRNCVDYLMLRISLFRLGYSPWNYENFLEYCTERLLLQRVGKKYRFMHGLLQEYLAQP